MNPNLNKVEPYDAYILHEKNRYLYKSELGRGSYGIVYLYQND